jgi:GT2 family glycosyltransferase/glycosyltransferase involved in cell wall biosynthesis
MQEHPSQPERLAARHYAETAARVQELEATLAAADSQLEQLRSALARVESSIIWQGVQGLRRRVYGRLGEDSRTARAVSAALRGAAAVAARNGSREAPLPTRPPPAVAEVPYFADPEVSLILPVHSQPELTAACVRAIVATATVPYELVVVDDTATASVKDVVARIAGATVLMNAHNSGYTRSLNRGSVRARGEFLLFLNDDTVPQPGWLEAMVECARSSEDVGVVVPMYLAPDGSLKEAGSIVWSDGSAENFGRGDRVVERSRYRYRREVDYGSGACLLVRTDLFRAIGGLDEQFSPAYYEDADLCFAAREAGSRVLYEPRARVVHVEGATAGTELSAGNKRFQLVNQAPFVAKWRHRLEEQPRRGGDSRLASRRSPGPQVLISDEKVPTPERDGGSRRMWRLIHTFRSLGCAVTFLPANGEAEEPYATRLEEAGVEVLRRAVDFEPELTALGPGLTLAVLSRPHVASHYVYPLRELAPGARIAYDAVDLHYLRELRRSLVENMPASARIDALRELELAMVRCCDMTIVVSDEEHDEVLRSVPGATVEVIPTIEEAVTGVPSLEGRAGIVFVGGFLHAPNVDAVLFLVRSVMPEVWRQRPDAELTIVGQHPPADVQALAGPRVDVRGWVDDIAPLLGAARVAVAPTRYGAGIQLKAIGAMAHGVPVVCTSLAAGGLRAQDGVDLLVADDPYAFAERICDLLYDDGLWRRLSDAGQALIREQYAPHVVSPRIEALLSFRRESQPSRNA